MIWLHDYIVLDDLEILDRDENYKADTTGGWVATGEEIARSY